MQSHPACWNPTCIDKCVSLPYSTKRVNESRFQARRDRNTHGHLRVIAPQKVTSGIRIVHERPQAEEFEGPNEELRLADRELEGFAYVASHDLRESVRMVNIYAQLLIQECQPAGKIRVRQFASHVEQGVDRIEQLIQSILQYSQAIHETRTCSATAVPLRRSLDLAVNSFRDALERAGAEINIGELPVVHGGEMQFAVVFENLISNSLKYASPGRPPRIRIWAQGSGDFWRIYFADNGIGFEPAFEERIFGLFQRLHGRAIPGTGTGLALCRRIIEHYAGHIRAEGNPQCGAIFILTLKGCNHNGSGFADASSRGQSR